MKDHFSRVSRYVMLLVFPALPFAQARFSLFGLPIYILEAIICCSLSFYVLALLRKERGLKRVGAPFAVGSMLVLMGVFLSAVLTPPVTVEELGALKSWIIFPVIAGFLIFQLIDDESDIIIGLTVWFLTVFAYSMGSLIPGPLSETTYDGRLTSIFPSPNHLSFYLLPGILIGWYLLGPVNRVHTYVPILFAQSAILTALVRTESLGAAAALGFGTATFFLAALFDRKWVFGLALGFLTAVVFSCGLLWYSGEWARLSGGDIRSPLASRVMIWNASVMMIERHPIIGIGPRNYQDEYLSLQGNFPPYLEWAVPHPHDVFLSFWLFGGVAAVAGFLVLLYSTLILAADVLSGPSGFPGRLPAALVLSLVSSFLVHGLVDDTYFRNDLSVMFWAVVALSAVINERKNRDNGAAVGSVRR